MSICRYCRGRILWAVTEKGHRIPIDPSPADNGNVMLSFPSGGEPLAIVVRDPENVTYPLYLSHFATCKKLKRRPAKRAPRAKTPKPQVVQTTFRLVTREGS